MTPTLSLDWLTEFAGERDWNKAPFSVTLNGKDYSGATNGRVLILIEGKSEIPHNAKAESSIAKVMADRGELACKTNMEEILLWAGEYEGPSEEPCDVCGGDGQHECSTPMCEKMHDCGACHGRGKVQCGPDVRHGIVGTTQIDRNLVAKWASRFAGPVELTTNNIGVQFIGQGWLVYQCMLNGEPEGDVPVLALQGQA
jgi:hypothetical protein